MIMVDATEATASAIEEVIVEECGFSGCHRLSMGKAHLNYIYDTRILLFACILVRELMIPTSY